ncbi:MAG: hypothetical protein WCF95_05895 [bacterium]
MRVGPKLIGVIAGSLLTITAPSFAQKAGTMSHKKQPHARIFGHQIRTFEGKCIDFMGQYNLQQSSKSNTLGFGLGIPKLVTFNDMGCRSCQGKASKDPTSINLDFAGLFLEKDFLGRVKTSFKAGLDITSEPFLELKRRRADLRLSNFTEFTMGEKVLTSLDSTKRNPANPYDTGEMTFKNPSKIRNLLGPLFTVNPGINKDFQGTAMAGLALESGQKPGLGFKAGIVQRFVGKFFGFCNVKGTVGRNNTEVQAGALFRLK